MAPSKATLQRQVEEARRLEFATGKVGHAFMVFFLSTLGSLALDFPKFIHYQTYQCVKMT
jgi:hypothetical protein